MASSKPKPERQRNPSPIGKEYEYLVRWEIELSATSHVDAARRALAIQRDPKSIATVFLTKLEHDESHVFTFTDLDSVE